MAALNHRALKVSAGKPRKHVICPKCLIQIAGMVYKRDGQAVEENLQPR
jgi:hypothetical protein